MAHGIAPKDDRLVWIDCEMTGLDPEFDELVEVSVVVTDAELNPLDEEGFDVLIKPSQAALDHMNDFVRNMHTTSGLLDELADGLSLAEAEEQVLAYVQRFVTAPGTAPLAGNTIGTDRMFLARYMKRLDDFLHYRNIDVSTIKELAKRWYPETYQHTPKKAGGHRALADILESIKELRYYRAAILPDKPGPSKEEARAAAASVEG